MSLVQINAIREIMEDAKQRLNSLTPGQLTPDGQTAVARCKAIVAQGVGEVGRLEQHEAKKVGDDEGIADP